MNEETDLRSRIPDLRDLTLEQLAALGEDTVLAHAVQRYRQRMREGGDQVSAFQAKI